MDESFTSQTNHPGSYCKSSLTDWIFGPKPVEDDDSEAGKEIEEERRMSTWSDLMENDSMRMEKEKDGPLPGFYQEDVVRSPPPLKSALASGDKRTSTHSVTFAFPVTPFVTSL